MQVFENTSLGLLTSDVFSCIFGFMHSAKIHSLCYSEKVLGKSTNQIFGQGQIVQALGLRIETSHLDLLGSS
jgi:hypothetical protein